MKLMSQADAPHTNRGAFLVLWLLCAVVGVACAITLAAGIRAADPALGPFKIAGDLMWDVLAFEFAVVAALILWKQPGNLVGWLLMIPALAAIPEAMLAISGVRLLPDAPASLSPWLWLGLWYSGWAWIPPIFAILLLPLLFPTGRPPSPRWRWVLVYALVMAGVFIVLGAFTTPMQLAEGGTGWTVPNPIGFIPLTSLETGLFLPAWGLNLALLTVLSFAGLIVRYRRATDHTRRQIKLLVFACGALVFVYVLGLALVNRDMSDPDRWWTLLFSLAVAAIPVVIAYSILRYRLFDIDLIIRRTLVYAIVTALLALVFYGGVLVLQRLFTGLTGQASPVALVASTLMIAALFSPLRRRVQGFVDRRFYRRAYDAQQVLAQFASVARNETDLERLAAGLGSAVEGALQPRRMGIWLQPMEKGEN